MAFPDGSFVLSIGMFCGAAAAFAADPVTDIGHFSIGISSWISSGSSFAEP